MVEECSSRRMVNYVASIMISNWGIMGERKVYTEVNRPVVSDDENQARSMQSAKFCNISDANITKQLINTTNLLSPSPAYSFYSIYSSGYVCAIYSTLEKAV